MSGKYIDCSECDGEGIVAVIDEAGELAFETCPVCNGDRRYFDEEIPLENNPE